MAYSKPTLGREPARMQPATGARTRYFRSAGARRRKALARAAAAALVLLVVAFALTRLGGSGQGTTEGLAQVGGSGEHLDLAWPSEGEAAVAVNGIGHLGSSGSGAPVPIASVAKVMTAYLVLRDHPLAPGEEGFRIEIDQADVEELHQRIDTDQSVVAVEAGEVLSERQALEALMLPSANNIAALLAVHTAGSVDAFVAEMNATAAELGMEDTHYTDPSGWDAATVSTANDQLKIGRAAMADPTFAEIVAMPATVLPVAGEVVNYNGLVGQEGFVGIKTGSHEAAGGCLLFAKRIEVDGKARMVIGVVLGQRQGDLVEAALAGARSLGASVAAALGQRGTATQTTSRADPPRRRAGSPPAPGLRR